MRDGNALCLDCLYLQLYILAPTKFLWYPGAILSSLLDSVLALFYLGKAVDSSILR
jgi:hypothetical protein